MADISATLAQLPLLRGLDEDALAAIAAAGVTIRLVAGDVLVRQGDVGDTLYLLLTGALRVRVSEPTSVAGYRTVASLAPGEVVGELALLASVPRSADVVAVEESSLLLFDRVHALGLLGAHPAIARRVMGQIATRLALAAPMAPAERRPTQGDVSMWQLKQGNEARLRPTLAAASDAVRASLAEHGVRSVRFFQHGRTLVRVWTAEGRAGDAPDPALVDAIASLTATIRPLLEEPDEEQGACVLVYEWRASGTAGT